MVIIYRNIYHRKCRIFFNFPFPFSNFDSPFKGQNFKTHFSGSVCIERRAIMQFSESLSPKELCIKKIRYPDLLGHLAFFASKIGLSPFIKKYRRLICTALSAPKGHCLDMATIYSCCLFDKCDNRAFNQR